jgi:hypothetical protein
MKKILTALASLTLVATTVPTVVACGQADDLKGQYVDLDDGNYDGERNLILDDNQMTNLLFYQVIEYIETHPNFRNTDDEGDPNNKIDQALP